VGNYREAARRAEEFLSVRNDSLDAATELAWYWANLGESGRARSMAEAALPRLDGPTPALRVAAVLLRMGDRAGAAAALAKARELGVTEREIAATPWLHAGGG
jgi:tetratricopeptide (TPR) repeat protein